MLAIRLSRLRSVVLGNGLTVVRVNRSAHTRQDTTRHAPTRHRPGQRTWIRWQGAVRVVVAGQRGLSCPRPCPQSIFSSGSVLQFDLCAQREQ